MSKVDVSFDSEIYVEVEVEAVVNPGYPAPACSNHDSPAFSDPGDPGEVEEIHVFLTRKDRTGKTIQLDITEFINTDALEEEAFECVPEDER